MSKSVKVLTSVKTAQLRMNTSAKVPTKLGLMVVSSVKSAEAGSYDNQTGGYTEKPKATVGLRSSSHKPGAALTYLDIDPNDIGDYPIGAVFQLKLEPYTEEGNDLPPERD